jgi:NADH:ubiquinone oxidoreductase subunit 4 (subunit M)
MTVVLTAAYILWTVQRVYLGTNPAYKNYEDINWRELACIIPLVVLAVLLGIFPTSCCRGWSQRDRAGQHAGAGRAVTQLQLARRAARSYAQTLAARRANQDR